MTPYTALSNQAIDILRRVARYRATLSPRGWDPPSGAFFARLPDAIRIAIAKEINNYVFLRLYVVSNPDESGALKENFHLVGVERDEGQETWYDLSGSIVTLGSIPKYSLIEAGQRKAVPWSWKSHWRVLISGIVSAVTAIFLLVSSFTNNLEPYSGLVALVIAVMLFCIPPLLWNRNTRRIVEILRTRNSHIPSLA
ncbi:MAG: hypothetical protein HY455_02095 [Parcubacteria group bacterium]|nr:hypothetical protein [Parcubacteria group bacterium]